MIYYSLATLAKSYSLSYKELTEMVHHGELKAEKLMLPCRAHIMYKYIIPETELYKIEFYKDYNPQVLEHDQPDYPFARDYYLSREPRYIPRAETTHFDPSIPEQYAAYLRTPKWHKLRIACFDRDGWQCRMCGMSLNLRAHHTSYDRFDKDGELDDLVTLCDTCHMRLHATTGLRRPTHKHSSIQAQKEFDFAE